MNDFAQLLTTFINPIILIMALVLMLSILARSGQTVVHDDLLTSGMFALALLYSMADPIQLSGNGIFDMRGLLIGTSTALMGPRVGSLVLLTGFLFRWYIGDPGVLAGWTSMSIAFVASLFWRRYISPSVKVFWKRALSLALMISLQSFAIFVAGPDVWLTLFASLGVYTLACNLLGTFLIMYLFHQESHFLSKARGLEKAATRDYLTGWLNRQALENRFTQVVGQSGANTGLTMLYFDVDTFKAINDTHGHAAGDSVLRAVTRRLVTSFRSQDIFARIGGDEFVVLMPNTTEAEGATIAERCRKLIADAPVIHDDLRIPVSISVGAIWARRSPKLERLLELADAQLYVAKGKGRNAVAFCARPVVEPHDLFVAAA